MADVATNDAEYDLAPGVTLDRQPLPTDIPEGHVGLVLQIENTYELHDDVTTYASVTVSSPPPAADEEAYDEWVTDAVIDPYTGVGRPDGDSWYDVEVLESTHPDVIPVGTTWDWGY